MPMNVARRSDGLLSAKQTLALLGLMEQQPVGRQEQHLLKDLAAFYPSIWSKGRNTIAFLRLMNVIVEREGLLLLSVSADPNRDWLRMLGGMVANSLVTRLAESGSGCLQANIEDGGLWLDSMLLPGAMEGFPLWIVEFSIATRDRVGSRFWRIDKAYEPLFLEGARAANKKRIRRTMTAAELEEKLDRDAIHGKEAEEWVVAFERLRLGDHPLLDQVRRISEENVIAGYDIASFSSAGTLHHDLFIEVKSYAGSKRFFWTRNEIVTAELLGENYSLYLVDRAQMHRGGYKPQIIPGPYSALFLSENSGWKISPTTYECIAPSPELA